MTCGIPQGSSLGPVLFLIYINDLPNSSNALTFRIFADDTNVFALARDVKVLKKIVNSELKKVKIWCDVNRLSINFSKTNFMIIKSQKKKDDQVNINMESADGTINVLQRKQKIKYLQWVFCLMKQCHLITIFHISVQELRETMVLYLS